MESVHSLKWFVPPPQPLTENIMDLGDFQRTMRIMAIAASPAYRETVLEKFGFLHFRNQSRREEFPTPNELFQECAPNTLAVKKECLRLRKCKEARSQLVQYFDANVLSHDNTEANFKEYVESSEHAFPKKYNPSISGVMELESDVLDSGKGFVQSYLEGSVERKEGMQVLQISSPLLLMQEEMPGLSSPVILAGRGGTITPTHRTDHYVSSSSFVYEGCQAWIFIHSDDVTRLEEMTARFYEPRYPTQCLFRGRNHLVTISLLEEWGIRYTMIFQKPHDLVLVLGSCHSVYKLEFTVEICSNFILPDEKSIAQTFLYESCVCEKDGTFVILNGPQGEKTIGLSYAKHGRFFCSWKTSLLAATGIWWSRSVVPTLMEFPSPNSSPANENGSLHKTKEVQNKFTSKGVEPRAQNPGPQSPKQERKFPCPSCSKSFAANWRLKRHINDSHANNALVCRHCHSKLKNWGSLLKHIQGGSCTKAQAKQNPCPICKERYKSAKYLQQHMRDLHPEHTKKYKSIQIETETSSNQEECRLSDVPITLSGSETDISNDLTSNPDCVEESVQDIGFLQDDPDAWTWLLHVGQETISKCSDVQGP